MIRIATLATLLPGAALAHGAHLPVPPEAHGAAHAAPLVAIALVVVALLLALAGWRKGS